MIPPPQRHSDPQLRFSWNLTQLSVLLLPFSTLLGIVGSLIAVSVIWRSRFWQFIQQPVYIGFAVLSGLLIWSSIQADSAPDAYLGLFNFLLFFFGFAGLSELIQTPEQLRRLAWLLVIPSMPVCLIGIGQMLLGWLGYRQVLDVQVLWVVVSWIIDPNGTPPGRMSANFFYANVLANYLVITFVLGLGLTIAAIWQKQTREKVFLVLTLLVNGIALILTNSRNAWAIAAGACLVFALYLGWRWLVVAVGMVVGMVLGAAFAPPLLQTGLRAIVPSFFWARLTDQMFPNRPVPTLRSTQWQFAWNLTLERPWLGWGLRNFKPLYLQETGFILGHPHNFPLMMLCETGIPATVLLFGLVGWMVTQGVRLLRQDANMIPTVQPSSKILFDQSDRLLLFSFLAAFMSNTVFNLFDVTFFDARLNLLGWLLLAGIWGLASTHLSFRCTNP
ncbi:MAG: O-antigen ligase family protein [Leptolyngbyaceae cyanobacterium bins.302]|nr:O-antigen ligase family protein [Leptolyngbyaceae cyanobacterium bins.302]